MLLDHEAFEHNLLAAVGPTEWLEVSVGAIHGLSFSDAKWGLAAPLLQGKVLLAPPLSGGTPGIALALGVLAPTGSPPVVLSGWNAYGYLALTQNIADERVLIHANLGVAALLTGPERVTVVTAGVGTQVRLYRFVHAVGEVFAGDPFDPRRVAPSMQVGFRLILSDVVQVDGTAGAALANDDVHVPLGAAWWGTLGLRLVTPPLWRLEPR
ncbi:MAG: hypothetical protein SFW67_14880 [Myxococcaceae bacterium]|nr:hypothetical protein [Myxococcaceae bacterium]